MAALQTIPGASKEECGRLGVMKYDRDDLPEGVTPADLRKCVGHRRARRIIGVG